MKKTDDIMVVGTTTIRPGERVTVDLPVADLYTSTSLNMPIKIIRGRLPGPVLFVSLPPPASTTRGGPGFWSPGSPTGSSGTETTGSPEFPSDPLDACPAPI